MGRLKVNFTLPLLSIILIEMAAFFYLSAEPGIFSHPATIGIPVHCEQSKNQHSEEQVRTVQLAILGYDSNNLPLAKLNIQKESQLLEGNFKLLLTHVVCSPVVNERFDGTQEWFTLSQSSGLASAWKSSIPIAYRQLLI
jgi:hypothetical protein